MITDKVEHTKGLLTIEIMTIDRTNPTKEEITEITETTETTTDLPEDNTTEILTEEDKTTEHPEDNNKDMNREDNRSEKEDPCNGLKSTKLVLEMTESTSLPR